MFCKNCGKKGLSPNAKSCPSCGEVFKTIIQKSKATSVLLAVFFSYWTWVYTYKADAWKFWTGLVLSILGIFLLFIPNLAVWVWSVIDASVKNKEWYDEFN